MSHFDYYPLRRFPNQTIADRQIRLTRDPVHSIRPRIAFERWKDDVAKVFHHSPLRCRAPEDVILLHQVGVQTLFRTDGSGCRGSNEIQSLPQITSSAATQTGVANATIALAIRTSLRAFNGATNVLRPVIHTIRQKHG